MTAGSTLNKPNETPVATARLRYVRGLDGLRAIAVIAVLIFHAAEPWLPGGFLGVDVFFVLSGYLITAQLLVEWQRHGRIDLAAFWQRRARRILAALYFLLAGVLAFALIAYPHEVATFRDDALAAFAYVANWYFILYHKPYFEAVGRPSPFLNLWSLGVEEQFYLFWPLLLMGALLLCKRRAAWLILIAAAASAWLMAALYQPGVDPSRLYYGTDTHASGLLLGAFLAFFWTPARLTSLPAAAVTGWRRLRAAAAGLLVDGFGALTLVALLLLFRFLNQSQPFLYQGGFVLVAIVTAVTIIAVSHPRARLVTALLEWAPVRWIGRRSYSIYLWHWPIIVFTRPHIDVPLSGLPLFVLRAGLALLLAEISYRLVEDPIRRGALGRLWHWFHNALRSRRWLTVALGGTSSAVVLEIVFIFGLFVARAPVPAPPPYLAISGIHTIGRPATSQTPAPVLSSLAPSATTAPVLTASATPPATASPSPTALPTAQATAVAVAPPPATAVVVPTPVNAGSVSAIGDSVMLGAAPALSQAIGNLGIDAVVGRQVSDGIQLLQQLQAQGALGQVVVIGLGSNGTFDAGQFDTIMRILAAEPRVVFINNRVPREWEQSNDAVIDQGVQRYPNARLVDWYAASANHPEYLRPDGFHLQPEGAAVYAQLVAQAVAGP